MNDLSHLPASVSTPSLPRPVRAPRGTAISCANWLIEGAYRMLQNNLDPEVAENPDALVVYGGMARRRATGIASTRSCPRCAR